MNVPIQLFAHTLSLNMLRAVLRPLNTFELSVLDFKVDDFEKSWPGLLTNSPYIYQALHCAASQMLNETSALSSQASFSQAQEP